MIDRRLFVSGISAAIAASSVPVRARDRSASDLVIDHFAAANGFSGSISLGANGRIRHQRLFGLADREARLPVAADTTFRIGSVSKWFTAVALLRMVDQGRMALGAPIRTHLPVLGGPYGSVSVEHLLANDSGIPDRVTQAIKDEPQLRTSRAGSAEMVARFAEGDLAFAPGGRFDYSFFNWVLLHAAMERVAGKPFEAVLAEQVFRPLGLSRTGFVDTRDGGIAGLAAAYGTSGRKDLRVPPFGGASGNIHANAADLIRAAYLINHGRLLSARSRAELVRVRVPTEGYALGGRVRTIGGRRVAWETGKVQGYRTHLAHDLRTSRSVLILNNSDLDQDVLTGAVEALLPLA
ncbi:serine hydrolase domain-containing protein [Sphingomonas swuensis]|uniref:Serine hydrolase domain-containing protein n=1 Tax=Sphingomonas swuensis TaxID=977800 RepID=A0ABP7SYA0_9SPHN